MPIKYIDGRYKIYPTVHNAKVKIIQGVYPLKGDKVELGSPSRRSLDETKVPQETLGDGSDKVASPGDAQKALIEGSEEQLVDPEDEGFDVQPEQDVEGEYELESILEHNKIRDKEYEYHVTFKGYEDEENIWLHQDELEGAPDLEHHRVLGDGRQQAARSDGDGV